VSHFHVQVGKDLDPGLETKHAAALCLADPPFCFNRELSGWNAKCGAEIKESRFLCILFVRCHLECLDSMNSRKSVLIVMVMRASVSLGKSFP
jgi:hypothetical protein